MRTFPQVLSGILIVIGGITSAHADVHKCKDASDNLVYQQSPCVGAVQEKKLDQPSAPAAQISPRGDPATMLAVAMTLGFKRYCDNTMPGFAEQISLEWSQWRVKNLAMIRQIEEDPRNIEFMKQRPDQMASFTREDARFVCRPQWVRDLVSPSSLQFASSPESTWRYFIDALAKADRVKALECYSMASRPKYGRILEELTDEQLRNQAATWKLVGSPTSGSGFREYFVQAGSKHVATVQFYLFSGNWLILEM